MDDLFSRVVGQDEIKAWAQSGIRYPFVLLRGQRRSGKTLLMTEIVRALQPNAVIYTEWKVEEVRTAQELAMTGIKWFAFDDVDRVSRHAQSALLRFVEETPDLFLIATISHPAAVVPPLLSRAYMVTLSPYTREQLQPFEFDPRIAGIYDTIGFLDALQKAEWETLYEMGQKIVRHLHEVSAANVFNIVPDLNMNEFELLMPMLIRGFLDAGKKDPKKLAMLQVLRRYYGTLTGKNAYSKKNLLDVIFLNMWRAYNADLIS